MRNTVLCLAAALLILAVGAQSSPVPPAGKVALLHSQHTRDFFAAHYPVCGTPILDVNGNKIGESTYLGEDPGNEYERYYRGWEWLFDREGIEYDLIRDDDITASGLSEYKLLILSNAALLSDDQTRAIHQWVLRGGRLLATFGSGYKDLVSDPRQIDGWKEQKGGTFGLHQLWHDPVGKLFSTYWIAPADPSEGVSVNINVTRLEGPTAGLSPGFLGYGAEANLLIQRPLNHPNVLAFLEIDNAGWRTTNPAIISTRQSKGLVVYFAFAPEYIVYKEAEYYEVTGTKPDNWPEFPDDWNVCWDQQPWNDRSTALQKLMIDAVNYLLIK